MVFESRYQIIEHKSRVILDKQFPFTSELNVGDKGILDAVVSLDKLRLEMDGNGNERLVGIMTLKEAELISKKARVQ